MNRLAAYIPIICIGEMAGVIALALGAWDTLACAVVGIVTALLVRFAGPEKPRHFQCPCCGIEMEIKEDDHAE